MSKALERNIGYLTVLRRKSSRTAKHSDLKKIDRVINLYTERKISNVTTAENLIKGLTSTDTKVYDKTYQKYKDNIKKFKDNKPLNQRMAEARTKKETGGKLKIDNDPGPRARKGENKYFVQFMLYLSRHKDSKIIRSKPAFKHRQHSFFPKQYDNFTATIKATAFSKDIIGKRIFKMIGDPNTEYGIRGDTINNEFSNTLELLRTDKDFKKDYEQMTAFYNDIECIKILSVDMVNKDGEKFGILTENLRDATNVSIFNRYTHTPLRMNEDTIHKAINKGNYIENECWINALTDFYSDTIMNERTRNRLTRERVIEIIGRDNFSETGATIQEMEAVFKQFKIPCRIYDCCNKLIYKCDPDINSRHIKPFYAMVKNSHIYAMNHDLKSIQQKQLITKIPTVKASTDYYINEREEPPLYRMIKNIDDILNIKVDEKTKEIYLVSEDNKLPELFFNLVNSGYEPRIRFQAGIISEIKMKFNKTIYIIKTQNLIKTSADGCIAVCDETTYNNMNKAMFNFNKSLFNLSHKSFYNDIDIQILDEARTVVPSGLLCDRGDIKNEIEIDISKAFTHAFITISEIPVFNQFDIWRVFDDTTDIYDLHDLTLYYIEKKTTILKRTGRMLFNKKYCLIYGVFLKQLDNMTREQINILYFKQPSFIHKVEHTNIVNELWNTNISEDNEEDKCIKKLVANVNYGLLEKGGATDQKSTVFKNLKEALNYQAEYGGKIHELTHFTTEQITVDEEQYTAEEEQASYYILNLKDTSRLRNGFRYVKELLLQYHNFRMYQDYSKLYQNGINVFSVKTDAFVIQRSDITKARELLIFNNEIGGWRVSNDEYIKFPTVDYEITQNELIQIPIYESKTIDIVDEYDTDNIIEIIEQNNPIMIRGALPGTGKSYICQKMVDKNYNVIFICPTNKLLQAFEGEAMTINKFFGINYGDAKLEPFDFTDFDVIVFDEVYFSNLNIYWRIKQFVEQNKHNKIIIATGDTKQLKPVQEITNTRDYEVYTDNIIDNIFEYNILLKECKRLNTQEDKDKLRNIKIDIFENKLPIVKVIEKYFEYTTDISKSINNIAFLNTTCKNVSNEIRKLENRKDEYEVE